jgi:hypothetical protein
VDLGAGVPGGSLADRAAVGVLTRTFPVKLVDQPITGEQTCGAWYREWRLTAFDGTTFTVPDSVENDHEFGRPGSGRGEEKTAYPQVQAACLVELGTHAVFDARLEEYAAAETMLIEEMFPALQPGMLVLADRHVHSFRRWCGWRHRCRPAVASDLDSHPASGRAL